MAILTSLCHRIALLISSAFLLTACAADIRISTVHELSESADAPYEKVLVIALFKSFDARRYLEKEVVSQLASLGTHAVASTTMMDTRTPVTRQTFVAMVEKIGAGAVLVTQLVSIQSEGTEKTRRPETTYNFRPTYYYNVWSVELTEYIEPPGMEYAHSLVLATQLFSVRERDTVWAIESDFRFTQEIDQTRDYSNFVAQAKAIATQMSRDGLLAR